MKKLVVCLCVTAAVFLLVLTAKQIFAAESAPTLQRYEFVTIRWGGRDHTYLIRSNGKVEMLGSILTQSARPDRVEDRAFYMNLAMNAVAKEGFEFAGMTTDEIVMKRAIQQ